MKSKKKLKRKLRKQNITHRLEVSDLVIQLDNVKYSLTFAEARASQLVFENDMLQALVNDLTKKEIQNENNKDKEVSNS